MKALLRRRWFQVIVVVALGGYMLYNQSQKPQLEIKVDKSGIQVNGNG